MRACTDAVADEFLGEAAGLVVAGYGNVAGAGGNICFVDGRCGAFDAD